jgi:hypothetical protein
MGIREDLEALFQRLPSSIAPRILDKKALEKDLENANQFLIQLKAKHQVDWEHEYKMLLQLIIHAFMTVGEDPISKICDYLEDMEKRLKLGLWDTSKTKEPENPEIFWNPGNNPLYP